MSMCHYELSPILVIYFFSNKKVIKELSCTGICFLGNKISGHIASELSGNFPIDKSKKKNYIELKA